MLYNKYATDRTNKEIAEDRLTLKYSIYNVRYDNLYDVKERISTDINNPTYTQDIYYSTIRNSLDNTAKARNKLTQNQVEKIAEDIITQQGYKKTSLYTYETKTKEDYFVKGDNTDKKSAKKYLKQICNKVHQHINAIYNIGNTGRLNGLKFFEM